MDGRFNRMFKKPGVGPLGALAFAVELEGLNGFSYPWVIMGVLLFVRWLIARAKARARTGVRMTRWLGYGRGQTSTAIRNDFIQR